MGVGRHTALIWDVLALLSATKGLGLENFARDYGPGSTLT